MSLHESRRSPARRIDDLQLLQGLLTQRLYVPEHDRRLLRTLLAATPRHPRTPARTPDAVRDACAPLVRRWHSAAHWR